MPSPHVAPSRLFRLVAAGAIALVIAFVCGAFAPDSPPPAPEPAPARRVAAASTAAAAVIVPPAVVAVPPAVTIPRVVITAADPTLELVVTAPDPERYVVFLYGDVTHPGVGRTSTRLGHPERMSRRSEPLEPGRWRVALAARGNYATLVDREIDVVIGSVWSARVEMTAPPRVTLAIEVVDAAGRPARDVRATIQDDRCPPRCYSPVPVGPDGKVELTRVPVGRYHLMIRGRAGSTVETVDVLPAPATQAVRIALAGK